MHLKLTSFAFLAAILALACTGDKQLNPNGDSELALLMRKMYDDALATKQRVQNGGSASVAADVEKILTAKATEPEKVASPEYAQFAQAYLASVKSLEGVSAAESPAHFTGMVNACMNCHEALCPGPTRRIKNLYLPN